MGNSHSHEQAPPSNAVADLSSSSMDVDLLPPPPPPSLPQAVPTTASSSSTTQNRRRSRAPSSPRLSSPPVFGSPTSSSRFPSFIRSSTPRTNRDGTTSTASSSSSGGPGGDRSPKDKKRRRISEMLGMSKSSSSFRGEGLAGGSASSSSREGGRNEEEVRMEEPTPLSTPLQDPTPTSPLPLILTPDQFPLPPSRPSSTPPATTNADDLPSPPSEDHDDDPLWSPRLRAQSLISQLSQEMAQEGTAPPVAAYIDSHLSEPTPPQSDLDMTGVPPLASATVQSSASSIGSGRSAESGGSSSGGVERQSLRGRLMSGLLGRGGSSGENGSASSWRSPSSTASTTETIAPTSRSAPPNPPLAQHQPQDHRGNVPTGTSLIVQGLVQTSAPHHPHTQPSSSSSNPSSSSATDANPTGRATRPLPDRRRSRSSAPSSTPSFSPSFDEQAILLGGLLSVATAATASSLLSPPPPINATTATSASGPAAPRLGTSTLESIRQRIARARSRSPAAAPSTAPAGIEEILRNYMSDNLNGSGSAGGGEGMTSATATIPLGAGAAATVEPVVPPELGSFEAFLADLQVDLVRALREYNGFPPAGEEGPALAPMTEDDVAGTSEGATEGGEEGAAATGGSAEEEAQARAAAVGGGGTGLGVEPRRLNWMRVYRFPPRNVQGTLAADRQPASDTVDDAASIPSDGASTSESTLSADPANNAEQTPPVAPTTTRLRDTSVTPMIMVGVRSISRADVQDAFGNGPPRAAAPQPATATRRASTSSLPTPSTSGTPASPASILDALSRSSSPSLDQDGDAVMDETLPSSSSSSGGPPTPSATNISRLRQAMRSLRDRRRAENGTDEEAVPAAQPLADRAGTRSFVLWVVGGLYSSDHPILAAPGLFGGTLDHDDLWALAELMGQAKPQTATSEAIANSGLEIIKGGMVKAWCEEKKVLENSADRCMVCLGDYEEEEECRILECKHVFHQECIDKWLHVGRNACPACRSPGVKAPAPATPSNPAPAPDTPSTTTTATTEEV